MTVSNLGFLAPNLRDMAPRHLSESIEHFTPPDYVQAARRTMTEREIDLDPASSLLANERIVRAERFFNEKANGYLREWRGRVFLNPPGGRCDPDGRPLHAVKGERGFFYSDGSRCDKPAQSSGRAWWFKLVHEFRAGFVTEAVFVAFSLELLQVTQMVGISGDAMVAFPLCVPRSRVAYYRSDGHGGVEKSKSPPHASAFIYLGGHPDRFAREFTQFGQVRL